MQRDSRKFIVGGGLSGLIFRFFNPDFQIISPELGGMADKTSVIWLHDTPDSRMLLEKLNLEIKPRKLMMGYSSNGWICDKLSPELNHRIIQKKMTDWNKEIDLSFKPKTLDLSTATKETGNYMKILDVDMKELVNRLKSDFIKGSISEISSQYVKVKFDDNEELFLGYRELVSTVPQNIFLKLHFRNEQNDLKSKPITLVTTKDRPKTFNDKYEIIYFDDSEKYSRLSKIGDTYTYEFTGEMSEKQFNEIYPEVKVVGHLIVKQGRLFDSDSISPPNENITFLGRFGEWNHKITIEHVIRKSLEYNANKQKSQSFEFDSENATGDDFSFSKENEKAPRHS